MFSSKSSRNGTYSVGLAVIVIAIAIVINLVAGQLPEKVRNIDISSNNLYDISSVSTKMLKKLDKKVDLKVIAEQDSVDTRIKTFVKKYAALSGKVKVEWVDSVLHPSVLQKYNTDGQIQNSNNHSKPKKRTWHKPGRSGRNDAGYFEDYLCNRKWQRQSIH